MNNVKIIYFKPETIDSIALNSSICSNSNYISHIDIRPGLLLVNFSGTARELHSSLEPIIGQSRIFIHDLDSGNDAFWGIMPREFWDWVKQNRH